MERIVIDSEKGEVQLRFNNDFYTRESIEEAAKDFSEVCEAKIEVNENETIVKLKTDSYDDLEKLGYEFFNYVLGLMKNRAEV